MGQLLALLLERACLGHVQLQLVRLQVEVVTWRGVGIGWLLAG
jgi:hypothetical protein